MAQKWPVLAGLTLGGLIGILHFRINASLFGKLPVSVGAEAGNPLLSVVKMVVYAVNQIVFLPLLIVSYMAGMAFFEGVVAGILLVPLVILINSITEVLRITHNNFE